MKTLTTILGVCLLGISGCAAPLPTIDYYKTNTATLMRIKPLQVIDEQALQAGDYKKLGKVSGNHCKRAEGMGPYGALLPAAKRSTIDQVRIRAAAKGATHITTPQCVVREGMDLVSNCWASIKCTSEALVSLSP